MKETCMKLTSIALTAIVGYQIYYNYRANEEMGGKYESIGRTLYAWVSLIPAVALGLFATKLCYTEQTERSALLQNRFKFDLCALLYLVLTILFVGMNLFRKVYNVHQRGQWQYIHSDWSSGNHDLYYWGVLQYGPALFLTLFSMHHFGRIFSKQHQHKCCNK